MSWRLNRKASRAQEGKTYRFLLSFNMAGVGGILLIEISQTEKD